MLHYIDYSRPAHHEPYGLIKFVLIREIIRRREMIKGREVM
jgi:hypothetical protein